MILKMKFEHFDWNEDISMKWIGSNIFSNCLCCFFKCHFYCLFINEFVIHYYLLLLLLFFQNQEPYYGKELGVFSLDGSPAVHGVEGTVYAMDDTRLWITGFSYDGLGPGKSQITTMNQKFLDTILYIGYLHLNFQRGIS